MAKAPYSNLFIGSQKAVVISTYKILVYATETGQVLHSTDSDCTITTVLRKAGPIRCAAISTSFSHLATIGDDKHVRIWEVDGLKSINAREVPKKPTQLLFSHDGQMILVSDKFGDVYRMPLIETASEEPRVPNKESAEGKQYAAQLLLGHVSLLTAFILTPDERYIITADRDEHIRVSWYPESYVVERYCLGHKKFVSSMALLQWNDKLLISGGGDPSLKIWDWMSGNHIHDISIEEAVMPFVKVGKPKGKRHGDGEGGENSGKPHLNSRQRRRARKAKEAKEKEGQQDEAHSDQDDQPVAGPMDVDGTESRPQEYDRQDPILVLRKLISVELESSRYIVFSAVGGTAIFYFEFSENTSAPTIHHLDLHKPVLDFTIGQNSEIWALLDAEYGKEEGMSEIDPMVSSLQFMNGALVQVESKSPNLLKSLNSNVSDVSVDELQNLDLYSWLSVMPKNLEVEHDAMDRDPVDPMRDSTPSGIHASAKERGRWKRKQVVLERMSKQAQGQSEEGNENDEREESVGDGKKQKTDE